MPGAFYVHYQSLAAGQSPASDSLLLKNEYGARVAVFINAGVVNG